MGTYDGARISLYVDGKLNNSELAYGKINLNDQPIYIGHKPDAPDWRPNQHWYGLIDDVRIYSYGLSAEEVKMLYEDNESL